MDQITWNEIAEVLPEIESIAQWMYEVIQDLQRSPELTFNRIYFQLTNINLNDKIKLLNVHIRNEQNRDLKAFERDTISHFYYINERIEYILSSDTADTFDLAVLVFRNPYERQMRLDHFGYISDESNDVNQTDSD